MSSFISFKSIPIACRLRMIGLALCARNLNAPFRRSLTSLLLNKLDGIQETSNFFVFATTARPNSSDRPASPNQAAARSETSLRCRADKASFDDLHVSTWAVMLEPSNDSALGDCAGSAVSSRLAKCFVASTNRAYIVLNSKVAKTSFTSLALGAGVRL